MLKGDFVKVGTNVGVIVFFENENAIPKNHFGVWYGEINAKGSPKYRTVPIQYCVKTNIVEAYH